MLEITPKKLVDKLNKDFSKILPPYRQIYYRFTHETDGVFDAIYFNGFRLWDADIEDREHGVDLETHIKNKFNQYIEELIKLKF